MNLRFYIRMNMIDRTAFQTGLKGRENYNALMGVIYSIYMFVCFYVYTLILWLYVRRLCKFNYMK